MPTGIIRPSHISGDARSYLTQRETAGLRRSQRLGEGVGQAATPIGPDVPRCFGLGPLRLAPHTGLQTRTTRSAHWRIYKSRCCSVTYTGSALLARRIGKCHGRAPFLLVPRGVSAKS